MKWLEHKRYSSNTVVTYRGAVTVFLRFWQQFGKFRIDQFTTDDINTFNFDYVVANGYSRSYRNQLVNAPNSSSMLLKTGACFRRESSVLEVISGFHMCSAKKK
jgi:site-specific recombinase XerD